MPRKLNVAPLSAKEKAQALARIAATRCGPTMKHALACLLDGDNVRAAAAAAGLASHQDVHRTAKALGIADAAKRASFARLEAQGRLAPRYARHVEDLRQSA